MKPKYLEGDSKNRDRWMVSYMDVLTILLIFFIAAAAQQAAPAPPVAAATVPVVTQPIVEQPVVKAEVAPEVKAEVKPEPAPERKSELAVAEEKLVADGLDVHREARGVVISLPQVILFAPGDDRITKNALPVVAQIAAVIRDLPNAVTLVGHADAVPIHNRRFRSNWELSAARGTRILELLSGEYGIAESRLSVSSDGANQPKSSNDTPEGRANNRRVEIVILDQ